MTPALRFGVIYESNVSTKTIIYLPLYVIDYVSFYHNMQEVTKED